MDTILLGKRTDFMILLTQGRVNIPTNGSLILMWGEALNSRPLAIQWVETRLPFCHGQYLVVSLNSCVAYMHILDIPFTFSYFSQTDWWRGALRGAHLDLSHLDCLQSLPQQSQPYVWYTIPGRSWSEELPVSRFLVSVLYPVLQDGEYLILFARWKISDYTIHWKTNGSLLLVEMDSSNRSGIVGTHRGMMILAKPSLPHYFLWVRQCFLPINVRREKWRAATNIIEIIVWHLSRMDFKLVEVNGILLVVYLKMPFKVCMWNHVIGSEPLKE